MKKLTLLLSIVAIFVGACSTEQKTFTYHLKGETMGTYYDIVYQSDKEVNLQEQIDLLLASFSQSLSTYIPSSLISRVNTAEGPVLVDDRFKEVFLASKQIYAKSKMAFDPTVAPIVNAWGFGFKNMDNVDSALIDSLKQYVGFQKIGLREDGNVVKRYKEVQLDFNAIAKGYGVDVVADYLRANGIVNFKVEIGGELVCAGTNPDGKKWRIGIEKPVENDSAQGLQSIITFTDKGMATSGNYRKFYYKDGVKYSHTINPKTGYPVNHSLLSATVLANNCMLADGYATACMVMGLEKAKEMIEADTTLEAYFIYADSTGNYLEYTTEGLKSMIEAVN